MPTTPLTRAQEFCDAYALDVPILMAPMAGACPTNLAGAVATGGGMGGCGALLMDEAQILAWASDLRSKTNGSFQMNLWIPDATPVRNAEHEAAMRKHLADWGPDVDEAAGDATTPDFSTQCDALIKAGPTVISSIMGLFPAAYVERMHEAGIKWFCTVTTVEEARQAEDAGADVLIAQGFEAGGHRGAFDPEKAFSQAVGLFSLLPAVVDAVEVPVVATGGIADGRAIAAALILGASAVQVGTGFLRTPEANIADVWAEGIGQSLPEDTRVTRGFSGRAGRSIATAYVKSLDVEGAPIPAPYPVQRGLTANMRAQAAKDNDIDRMQVWAGQSAALAQAMPAADLTRKLWEEAKVFLA